MNIATLQAAHRLRVPVWIAEHSNPAKQKLSTMWELWRMRTYPHCAGCIVLTKDIAEYMQRWIDPKRICVIPNAIATPVAQHNEHKTAPNNCRVVLALGRLSPEKGVDILVKAWRQIHSQVGDWELHIAGDGPQRSELEELSRDLPKIKFLGWMDNPWEAYAKSSIYVLPSRYEGFPVALVEAMSQRLACVSTRSSDALNELSADQTAVRLVDLESPEQLGESMLALIQAPLRRKELGDNAQILSRNYSWEKIGPLWDQLLLNATQLKQTRSLG
jgi:glycosyltransferase involved in cell wall biosynthesis